MLRILFFSLILLFHPEARAQSFTKNLSFTTFDGLNLSANLWEAKAKGDELLGLLG